MNGLTPATVKREKEKVLLVDRDLTYDCLESFVAHVAHVWSVVAVHFEMLPNVRDAFKQFAALPTLVLALRRVHGQVFVERVLRRECFPAHRTPMWTLP